MFQDAQVDSAVAFVRQHLEADPLGTRQEYAEIERQLTRRGILFGGKPLPICISPALMTRTQLRPLQQSMQRLIRVLAKLQEPLRQPEWLDRLGISPEEQELIRWPCRVRSGGYISRVDGFLERMPDGSLQYRIVELNVDSPGGAAFMDECVRLLRKTSLWRKLGRLYPGAYYDTDSRDLPLLLKSYRQWGGTGKPRLAVVDWITVNTVSEFELLKARYNRLGIETIIADPRELEYRDGRLLDYDGKPIDLIYRRVLVEDLIAQPEAAGPLLRAFKDQAVCVVNTFACKPLTVKSLLSWVHRPEFEPLLSKSSLAFLRSLVPWTADVVEDPALLRKLRDEQEQLILKPADGYGGQGIYLGWEMGAVEWDRAIDEALAGRYVAQSRVHIPRSIFPIARPDGWSFEEFRMDFDPYMFGAGMGDPLVRLAQSDILNVKAGAQIAATWVIRD